MSHHSSSSYTFTSSSSSSSSSTSGPHTTSQTTHSTYSSDTGGSAQRVTHETGKPSVVERVELPAAGSTTGGTSIQGGSAGRIEDVTDRETEEEKEADRRYREAMEDEYAKREGGA